MWDDFVDLYFAYLEDVTFKVAINAYMAYRWDNADTLVDLLGLEMSKVLVDLENKELMRIEDLRIKG